MSFRAEERRLLRVLVWEVVKLVAPWIAGLGLVVALLLAGCSGLPRDAEEDLRMAARVARAEHEALAREGCDAAACERLVREADSAARLLEALDERMRREHGFSSWIKGVWHGLSGGD